MRFRMRTKERTDIIESIKLSIWTGYHDLKDLKRKLDLVSQDVSHKEQEITRLENKNEDAGFIKYLFVRDKILKSGLKYCVKNFDEIKKDKRNGAISTTENFWRINWVYNTNCLVIEAERQKNRREKNNDK